MKLSDKQEIAIDGALKTLRRGYGKYCIGGYAGTGKTTIIKRILEQYGRRTMVSAFCGKAAQVLRKKGVAGANTIHSCIYRFDNAKKRFVLVDDIAADAIVIDEGSMVPLPLWQDLCSFKRPIIVVGDPGQLKPIGTDACLLDTCDIVLDIIHRNAGTIANFAAEVRRTGEFPRIENDQVQVRKKSSFRDDYAKGARWDVYLCGFNKTRVALNQWVMGAKRLPQAGDRLIILQNNRDWGLFNGSLVTVERIISDTGKRWYMDLDSDGVTIRGVPVSLEAFNNADFVARAPSSDIYADYGYSATVHKFQGSETDNVCFFDEQCQHWPAANHRYTAVTRAIDSIRVYVD